MSLCILQNVLRDLARLEFGSWLRSGLDGQVTQVWVRNLQISDAVFQNGAAHFANCTD